MTQNLLVERLKAAKRELTALKTAHTRGLGLVKIYTQNVNIDVTDHQSGIFLLTIQINFDTSFAAYPFTDGMSNGQEDYAELIDQGYSNGGYSMYQEYLWSTSNDGQHKITVFSTSPISSISYSWGSP